MRLELPFIAPLRRIAILGGGVTGLSAAHDLSKKGHAVRVFEVADRVGGAVRTDLNDGWLMEHGPHTMREDPSYLSVLLHTIGAERQRVFAAPAATRHYVVRRGRPVAAPRSALGTAGSLLLPPWTKVRGLFEMFLRAPGKTADVSFAELARRHFGRFASDYVAQALAAGLYAGDAGKLSTRYAFPKYWEMWQDHGSLLRARAAHVNRCYKENTFIDYPLFSFARGMQTVTHGLVVQLPADVISPNARVEGLVPGPIWHVIWRDVRGQPDAAEAGWSESDDTGRQVEAFDIVISALPAPALARLAVGDRTAHPLAGLSALPHAPVATLFLGFRRGQVGHPLRGYGLAAPPCERLPFASVTFSSSFLPNRAPEGHVALTVAAGGAVRPELAALPTEELLAAVMPDLRSVLRIRGDPVFVRRSRRSVPQYPVGHERLVESIIACEQSLPGLFIGGSPRGTATVQQALMAGEWLAYRANRYAADSA